MSCKHSSKSLLTGTSNPFGLSATFENDESRHCLDLGRLAHFTCFIDIALPKVDALVFWLCCHCDKDRSDHFARWAPCGSEVDDQRPVHTFRYQCMILIYCFDIGHFIVNLTRRGRRRPRIALGGYFRCHLRRFLGFRVERGSGFILRLGDRCLLLRSLLLILSLIFHFFNLFQKISLFCFQIPNLWTELGVFLNQFIFVIDSCINFKFFFDVFLRLADRDGSTDSLLFIHLC